MMQHVVLNVTYNAMPGKALPFVRALDEAGILAQIREEAGCIQYEYFLGVDNPDRMVLVERWESMDALTAHAAQPFMKQLMEMKDQYILQSTLEKFNP